jgi:hypothetical protein
VVAPAECCLAQRRSPRRPIRLRWAVAGQGRALFRRVTGPALPGFLLPLSAAVVAARETVRAAIPGLTVGTVVLVVERAELILLLVKVRQGKALMVVMVVLSKQLAVGAEAPMMLAKMADRGLS